MKFLQKSVLFLSFIIIMNCVHILSFLLADTSAEDTTEQSYVSEDKDDLFGQLSMKKMSETERKIYLEHVKKSVLKIIGLKEEPRKSRNKVYIPHEMLKRYKRMRASVKDVIPNDKDYYGGIWDESHNSLWSEDSNQGVEVDLESQKKKSSRAKRFYYSGTADTITCLTSDDKPGVIPKQLERQLPPHNRYKKIKNFQSVHLNFNFSREHFNPSVNKLKAAELRLTRQKPPKEVQNTEIRTSLLMQPSEQNNDLKKELLSSSNAKIEYQTVYVLQILDYDMHNEPITRIVDLRRINTSQTTPLVFDVYAIVRHWIKDPSKNFGLIIRVADDNDQSSDLETLFTENNPKMVEHVRLSRKFGSTSEASESWIDKQPMILVYTGSQELDEPFKSPLVRNKRENPSSAPVNEDGDEDWDENENDRFEHSDHLNDEQKNHAHSRKVRSPNSNRQQNSQATRRVNHKQSNSSSNRGSSSNKAANQTSASRNNMKNSKLLKKCSKRPLKVDFDNVGWNDWIIAPHSYYANYCAGDCSLPLNDNQNASNHAIIQSLFYESGRVLPKTCCVPTKLGAMAILFSIDGLVQLKNYNDMIVESCGCL